MVESTILNSVGYLNDNRELLIFIIISIVIIYILIYLLSSLYKWPIILVLGFSLGIILKQKCKTIKSLLRGDCNTNNIN